MPEIDFHGEKFAVLDVDEISEFALMEFAGAAEDFDEDSLEGLALCLQMLRDVIDPKDWPRFRKVARAKKAKVEDMLPIIVGAMTGDFERPTGLPSDSSDGQLTTSTSSVDGSSSAALRLLQGRADLQDMVLLAQEARSA